MRTITVAGVTFNAKEVVAVTLRRNGRIIEIEEENEKQMGFVVENDMEAELVEDEYEGEDYGGEDEEEDD